MKANLTSALTIPVDNAISVKLKSLLDATAKSTYALISSLFAGPDRSTLRITGRIRYEHLSDVEVMALVRGGDENAFEFIYKTYVKDLYRFARKNISTHEECEEIIQDIFLSLWERHEKLNILTIKFYLLNCVRYGVIQYFRKSKLKRRYAEHFALFEAVYDTLPESERDSDTILVMLERGIAQLPKRCQEAVRLRLSEDLSNKEIAQQMNINIRTVETYFSTAFNRLRVFCRATT